MPDDVRQSKLNDGLRTRICEMLGAFYTYQEIQDWLEKEQGIRVSKQALTVYKRGKKWAPIYLEARSKYEAEIDQIPISSKAWRIHQRYMLFGKAIKGKVPDYSNARNLLLDVAKELDQISPEGGGRAPEVTINLALVSQINALPEAAQLEYLRTGKLPPSSYLLDVTSKAEPAIEAETLTESDDQDDAQGVDRVPLE